MSSQLPSVSRKDSIAVEEIRLTPERALSIERRLDELEACWGSFQTITGLKFVNGECLSTP